MLDIDEEKGLAACTELQKEYHTENVMFITCDVSDQDQLVSWQVYNKMQIVESPGPTWIPTNLVSCRSSMF